MAFKDLPEFIAALEKRGWLKRIRTRVSPILEITEITDRVSKMPGGGPALLFENVEGSNYPVAINLFGSMERMCLALGVNDLDEIGAEIKDMMKMPAPGGGLLDKLGAGLKALDVLKNSAPKVVSRAPCQEVVETDPDLSILPALQCWPHDGGRYITLTNVYTKDPVTGMKNIGMYRVQIYDKNTTGMHWQKHKDAQRHQDMAREQGLPRIECAVVLGGDPATIYCGSAPLPPVVPELMFAGFLRRGPVEVVKCKTIDMEVPAHAEFVIEGYVDPNEQRVEGPFGDHTGFYSPADPYPVFHVTCITRKRNPIYPSTIVGKPPQEDVYLGKATERIFLPMLQMVLPEVLDYNLPPAGTFHNCCIIKMKKRYPGHVRKVVSGMWGLGLMMLTKTIIVLDADADVHDLSEVAFRAFANVDPKRDIFFTEGPVDDLDHAAPMWRYGSKMGVDATRKGPEDGHTRPWPEMIDMSLEIKALVDRKWREYGL